jgi:hypothetical protein
VKSRVQDGDVEVEGLYLCAARLATAASPDKAAGRLTRYRSISTGVLTTSILDLWIPSVLANKL